MLLTKLTDYSKILFEGVDSLDCWNGPVTNCPIGNAELLELPRADMLLRVPRWVLMTVLYS